MFCSRSTVKTYYFSYISHLLRGRWMQVNKNTVYFKGCNHVSWDLGIAIGRFDELPNILWATLSILCMSCCNSLTITHGNERDSWEYKMYLLFHQMNDTLWFCISMSNSDFLIILSDLFIHMEHHRLKCASHCIQLNHI